MSLYMRLGLITFLAVNIAACKTVPETICAKKAEIIGAAEATIKLLNETCPVAIPSEPAQ